MKAERRIASDLDVAQSDSNPAARSSRSHVTPQHFYLLGGHTYRSKDAIKREAQRLLHAALGPITDRREHAFLADLVEMHPDCDQKIGGGIERFERRAHRFGAIYGRGFYIIRTDGSSVDFSLHICVRGYTERSRNVEACREAVWQDVAAYKAERFGHDARNLAVCEASGLALSWDDAHVDHVGEMPFREIFREWLEREGYHELTERNMRRQFYDPEVRARFREFHSERAKLKLVHRDINLGRERSGWQGLLGAAE